MFLQNTIISIIKSTYYTDKIPPRIIHFHRFMYVEMQEKTTQKERMLSHPP